MLYEEAGVQWTKHPLPKSAEFLQPNLQEEHCWTFKVIGLPLASLSLNVRT